MYLLSPKVAQFGKKMSTVNWCEEDYVKSDYIAEWYNTLTSGSYIVAGILGIILHQSVDRSIFHTLMIVGVGSILFHAMLSNWTQLADEIPMVILIMQLLGNTFPTVPKGFWRVFGFVFCTVMTITAYKKDIFGRFEFYFFQLSYVGLCGIFALYNTWMCMQNEPFMTMQAKMSFGWGGFLFLAGWSMWLLEQRFCDYILDKNLPVQLHAFWHVLSAKGAYYLCTFSIYMRSIKEGRRVRLVKTIVPRVVSLQKQM